MFKKVTCCRIFSIKWRSFELAKSLSGITKYKIIKTKDKETNIKEDKYT